MINLNVKDLSRLLDLIIDDMPSNEFIQSYSKSDFMGHQFLLKICVEKNWCHVLLSNNSENHTDRVLFDLHIENTVEIYCNLETKTITIEQEEKTFFTRIFLNPYIAVEIQKAMCENYIYRTESI